MQILDCCEEQTPLLSYYKGIICLAIGRQEDAIRYFKEGEAACPDYCFPSHIEEIEILQDAIRALGNAPMACYYLGNLFYDKKQYGKAIELWENTTAQLSDFAMAWRNLSIAYYNKQNNPEKAMTAMKINLYS